MYSRCVYVCWYVTCIDVASQICRIMKRIVLVSCQLAPLALCCWLRAIAPDDTYTKKGYLFFSFFVSTCTSCPKNQWDFQDYNVRWFISYFDSTPKSSSRPTMKTSHLINIHPTPVTQPWTLICSFPILSISLSRIYFVLYPPKSSLGFHCWRRWWWWGKEEELRKRKDARDLFGFKPKIFFDCAKKQMNTKTQNKISQLMLYIIPPLV
jgi:hypothetical protein